MNVIDLKPILWYKAQSRFYNYDGATFVVMNPRADFGSEPQIRFYNYDGARFIAMNLEADYIYEAQNYFINELQS